MSASEYLPHGRSMASLYKEKMPCSVLVKVKDNVRTFRGPMYAPKFGVADVILGKKNRMLVSVEGCDFVLSSTDCECWWPLPESRKLIEWRLLPRGYGREAYVRGELRLIVKTGIISGSWYLYEPDGHVIETLWNHFRTEKEAMKKAESMIRYTEKTRAAKQKAKENNNG